ncbi:MAG TPA: hypothetical protein DIU35_07020 [Candidatus Latescibacteria bacterium]|nr:hypothetical protein [Gemmatimonadota bacterium]HCR17219.1 hypothetical protein [Candidatus Latescibacterota bacterium]|tara:strand:- start:706 stop:915 length:210 start_codon:yes stop_codon:yes gene_type:complete
MDTTEPLYPVEIGIGPSEIPGGENNFTLAYGMHVSAKIIIERGRVFDLIRRKVNKVARDTFKPDLHMEN